MSYKILYIEDLDGASVKNNLERCDIEVIINNASGFDETLNDIEKTFDAYIMDFRLDAKTGRVNAPTFASTIRGFAKDKHQCPIILVSNEVNLVQYDKDFTCHDLFDMVIRKARSCCIKCFVLLVIQLQTSKSTYCMLSKLLIIVDSLNICPSKIVGRSSS